MKKITAIIIALMSVVLVVCGCSNSNSQNEKPSLSTVYENIKSQVELSELSSIDTVAKLDKYYGIAETDVEEYVGGINRTGENQEEIVLIKATNDDSASKIKKSLDARYSSKLNENINYYPKQAEMIKKCKVEQNGLYITMIISPNASKITEIVNSAIK